MKKAIELSELEIEQVCAGQIATGDCIHDQSKLNHMVDGVLTQLDDGFTPVKPKPPGQEHFNSPL